MAYKFLNGSRIIEWAKSTFSGGVHTPHVNVDSLEIGYGANNLGKQEGGTHADADVGVELLAVHRATPAASSTAGKYSTVNTDAKGRVWTNPNSDLATVNLTPTITAGTYDDGDGIGGLLTFSGASLGANLRSTLRRFIIVDSSGNSPALEMFFFDVDPSSGSTVGNGSTVVIAAGFHDNFLGSIKLEPSAWKAIPPAKFASIDVDMPFTLPGTDLFGVLVCWQQEGVPVSFAATDSIKIRLIIEQ